MPNLRPAAVLLVLFTLLTGVAYPLVVTGASQVLFPKEAKGSLLFAQGKTVGSTLIGQPFDDASYFWGRPSATASFPYNASSSSGSNLGPTNPTLHTKVRERVVSLRSTNPSEGSAPIPVDLVTASGSGLDPHISPAAALYQVHRVARSRKIEDKVIEALVLDHIEGRTLQLLGEPRVNVLLINIALDQLARGGA